MPHLFSYGSNSPAQLRQRLHHSVEVFPAVLEGYKRIFVGYSGNWDGPVASLAKQKGGMVLGSLAKVSDADLDLLDRHEGVANKRYARSRVKLKAQMVAQRPSGLNLVGTHELWGNLKARVSQNPEWSEKEWKRRKIQRIAFHRAFWPDPAELGKLLGSDYFVAEAKRLHLFSGAFDEADIRRAIQKSSITASDFWIYLRARDPAHFNRTSFRTDTNGFDSFEAAVYVALNVDEGRPSTAYKKAVLSHLDQVWGKSLGRSFSEADL